MARFFESIWIGAITPGVNVRELKFLERIFRCYLEGNACVGQYLLHGLYWMSMFLVDRQLECSSFSHPSYCILNCNCLRFVDSR